MQQPQKLRIFLRQIPVRSQSSIMSVRSSPFFSHSLFSSIATPSFSSKRFFAIAKASVIMGSSQKPVILQTVPMLPDLQEALDSKFEHLRLWEAQDKKAFVAQNAHKIRGIVGSSVVGADREMIDALPNLEIVSSFSVGLDKIDLARCKERGIVVTNTPDVLTDETADTAMALLLATMRRVCAADRYVRQGLWPIKGNFPLSYKVTGKRIGIVGLGRIGMAVAQRAEAFGCHIAYYSRNQKPDCAYHYYKTVLELAKGSDVLVITCALTKETTHIVNKEVIDALGAGGTVVNVARGPVIDEQELVKALLEGRLGAAGLDVFENEPYVPEELFPLENVVLLPHVGSATWETRREMANLVVQNLEAHFSGQPLLTPVH